MEMNKRIEIMALKTWDAIGGDCLKVAEEMGKVPVMTQEEVIEIVCDASYMKMYGDDAEAYDHWNSLPTYEEKIEAVKPAFSFAKYGWQEEKMSLSDCLKCWDTPCTCGWEYRNYPISALKKWVRMFETIIDFKQKNPDHKFSTRFSDPETEDDKKFVECMNDFFKRERNHES